MDGDLVRVVDFNVLPGVSADMATGDQWPDIADLVRRADVLVFATPTWLGHMSSVAQRALERLDAELSNTDAEGRPAMFGKTAVVAVVGNEDGAHKIIADAFQALNDIGFTIPAQGATYWNSEAMNPQDYKDLDETPGSCVDHHQDTRVQYFPPHPFAGATAIPWELRRHQGVLRIYR